MATQGCGPKMKLMMRRLGLLLWKNWLLRKRNLCSSIMELVWPIAVVVFFFWLFTWVLIMNASDPGAAPFRKKLPDGSYESDIWEVSTPSSVPYKATEEEMFKNFREKFSARPMKAGKGSSSSSPDPDDEKKIIPVLGYAPYTPLTEAIIREAGFILKMPPTFVPRRFHSNEELEKEVSKSKSDEKPDEPKSDKKSDEKRKLVLGVAVVFERGLGFKGKWAGPETEFPKEEERTLAYKIRFLKLKRDGLEPRSDSLSTNKKFLNKREAKDIGENAGHYVESGFAGLQIAIDKAIIQLVAKKKDTSYQVNLQALPSRGQLYPSPRVGGMISPWGLWMQTLPLYLILGYMLVIAFVAVNVSNERSTGVKELMKMSGLPNWMHWLAWMLHSLVLHMMTAIFVVLMLFMPAYGGLLLFRHTNMTLWWFVLLLFLMATTAFGFFLSNLLGNGTVAAVVGVLGSVVLPCVVAFTAGERYEVPTFSLKMATSLLPSIGLHWTVVALCSMQGMSEFYDRRGDKSNRVGGYWKSMGVPIDDFSIGYGCLILFVDTVMYVLLAMYLENVWPGEYGLRKPFYYIFIPPEWMVKRFRKSNRVEDVATGNDANRKIGFEPDPNLVAVVDIQKLTKRFGKLKTAVKGISFKMFDGQITVLLGHNGAGKTTAMSMMTGLTTPTSGTAIINGMDINREMDDIRQNMGLCPQHNMLFDHLTVHEHLKFFALIKGLTFKQADAAATDCLKRLHFEDKTNAKSKTLSGGQKRKLCLGMALIGETKLLVLDEPSSGMDPETRRAVWDLLLEIRDGRAILLTTHFMEEADALGDRVVIMAEGEVQCCGTPMFLKQAYGAGYTLKFTTVPNAQPDLIVDAVKKHIPNAYLKNQKFSSSSDMALTLPSENNVNSFFPSLFSDLSRRKSELGVLTMSLQLTTMDEVFVRVGELSLSEEGKADAIAIQNLYKERELKKLSGTKLACQQFVALLLKRMQYCLRKPLLVAIQIVFPLIMLYLAISVFNSYYEKSESTEELKITISKYSSPITYYSDSKSKNKDFGKAYAKHVGSSATKLKDKKAIISAVADDPWGYKWRYIIGAEWTSTGVTAMFSPYAVHSTPLSINAATNAILKTTREKFSVHVSNHPFPPKNEGKSNSWGQDNENGLLSVSAMLFGSLTWIGLIIFSVIFIVFPVSERLCKAKQIQLMTGVSPLIFWGASMLWDNIIVWILAILMVGTTAIFQIGGPVNFNADHGLGVLFLIIVVFGFATVSHAYVNHLFPPSVTKGFVAYFVCYLGFGILAFCIPLWVYVGAEIVYKPDLIYATYILAPICIFFLPTYGIHMCLFYYANSAKSLDSCNQLNRDSCKVGKHYFELTIPVGAGPGPGSQQSIPGPGLYLIFLFLTGCLHLLILFWVEHKSLVKISKPKELVAVKPEALQPADPDASTNEQPGQGPQSQQPAAGQMLAVQPIPSYTQQQPVQPTPSTGQISEQYQPMGQSQAQGQNQPFQPTQTTSQNPVMFSNQGQMIPVVPNAYFLEENVMQEKMRIDQLVASDRVNEDSLVVDKLTKQFDDSFIAVTDLSFGVHYGECFGLLGVNGAGKTTAFRMITGDEDATQGTAYTHMFALNRNPRNFLQNIGYCPQFDTFFSVFTGKEMLKLYCRLRGVAGKASVEADRWLKLFGLYESRNIQCHLYSGGMKRRLCAAMAMIGDPPVILFDEPTSGVDPMAQHQFWDMILDMRGSEQAVVLTSHSMGECETLCSRIGIMVNGQFQCFGGIEHLKHKYGEGYTLFIKLMSSLDSGQTVGLREEIEKVFSPCYMKDQHQNIIQYHVLNATMSYGEIFQATENLKSKFSDLIEEYSVNDTSLEEVFLTFARKQYPERKHGATKCSCRKCMFCDCDCTNRK